MKHNAHKTAIRRKRLSAPASWLDTRGKIVGDALDYGCGHGDDARTLGMDAFDPAHAPDTTLTPDSYDTITCTYVLNTIAREYDRRRVVDCIYHLLKPGGVAYITVRADDRFLTGLTTTGTWQGKVYLDLPIEHEVSGRWRMYRLAKTVNV